jgi:hypothetical protein
MLKLRVSRIAGAALVFTLLLSLVSASWAHGNPDATLYVLAVGVNGSCNAPKEHLLRSPSLEAREVGNLLQAQQGNLFQRVEVKVLSGKDGTRENILRELQNVRRQANQGDMVVIYFCGHGGTLANQWIYETYDSDSSFPIQTSVTASDLRDHLRELPAQGVTVVLFLDTCHAGMADLYKDGMVVFAACLPKESSVETGLSGGLFTRALKEGLSGRADLNQDGVVTVAELDLYLTQRVAELKARFAKSVPQAKPIAQQVSCGRPTSVPGNLPLVKSPLQPVPAA